jgi:hypothetical protein
MQDPPTTAQFYRERSAELYQRARQLSSEPARSELVFLAVRYERLAADIERRESDQALDSLESLQSPARSGI